MGLNHCYCCLQVLHAAMVLLDRLAVQGYVSQCDPLAAAAAVAAAATREGIAIDAAMLAGTLDYNVSPLCCAAWP